MVSISTAKKAALAFDEVVEQPHFEKTSFRVKKKIFATLDEAKQKMVVKLSEIDQSVFCNYDGKVMHPVSGGWGKQGWTVISLKRIPKGMFLDALTTAYCTVAPKKLSSKYKYNSKS